MALATRLTAATIGLILLGVAALAWLSLRDIETLTLLAGLLAAACVLALGLIAAHAYGGTAARLRDNAVALKVTANQRDSFALALEQYGQRERMFVTAVEAATYPVIIKTPDGTISGWNPAAERLYKYSAAEAIGKNIRMIIPADRYDDYAAILDKALKDEPIENFETVRVDKDGRRIDVSLSVRPIKSSSGETVAVVKITRDMTAQKSAEEKFRLAVEACPSGMVMIDRDGKIVMVNSEVERLFGYSRAELMRRPIDMLMPEWVGGQNAWHREGFTGHPETPGEGARRDLFGRRKNGSEFPAEVGLNPIHTREGVLVLSVIVDISERKRMERLKDDFVSTVSHELRTPLTSIAGSLGLLVGGATGKLPDAAMRLLTIAQTNSQRLVRLINDILDIEKMESGQTVFNFKRWRPTAASPTPMGCGCGSRPPARSASCTPIRTGSPRWSPTCSPTRSNSRRRTPT
jgi:PAS domain S-box-containing protein